MRTIVLDNTKTLTAVLGSAVTSDQPEFMVAYADNNGTSFTEGGSEGELNSTTPVTLVSAPASGTRRVIKSFTIYNKDSADVTVSLIVDSRTVASITLNSGDSLTESGVYNNEGKFKSSFTATASEIGSAIDTATEKTTPVDADKFSLFDTALKWVSWSNIKSALSSTFATLSGGNTFSGDQTFNDEIVKPLFQNGTSGRGSAMYAESWSNSEATSWTKIADLPSEGALNSSAHLILRVHVTRILPTDQLSYKIEVGSRGDFLARIYDAVGDLTRYDLAGIAIYENPDATFSVYMKHPTGDFAGMTVEAISSGFSVVGTLVHPTDVTEITTTPTGTLVFDSTTAGDFSPRNAVTGLGQMRVSEISFDGGTNVLSSQEEAATFTPSYTFTTSGSVTHGSQSGEYMVINGYCFFSLRIFTDGISSPTGSARINGLPKVCSSQFSNDQSIYIGRAVRFNNAITLRGTVKHGNTFISLYNEDGSATLNNLLGSDFRSGSSQNIINISGFYPI